ncbi:uncharacterized protein Z519_03007 [Cladophialophora bantiana CBS 173.52]|uniref:DUF1996 domain-containing protein n=1 Tax=Cladophialophora bantiana (strain ATCC 10958 / CBS 173.52 / CDC B-1940 / NIH 8579) TaxID=1442370 RepID=A0A0D2F192_CLAB1|nr:uncharacterized protein Z519_03007 [Cladophialophora bantiana CBS 173.52]KIW95941.1 hypothetical protein Z519_03007 [Cladophialophora bantiana CBS 173.52]
MKSLDLSSSLWALMLLPSLSHAYWRMACSVSQTARIDLILNPGDVSGHVHKFAGGSNVNQNSDFNSLQSSNCSSCEVQKDKSAYWTPQLYYAHANGSFEEVPNYGMTVYYVGRGGDPSNTVPFPPGFKMITGDSRLRSYDNTTLTYLNTRPVADRVSFHCIDEANDIPEQHYMFRTDCVNGMRAQVNFQSCWDGVNLYLDNNAHVDYLSGIDYGECPPSHPVHIPGLFFEVLYWTNSIDQSAGGQFVFSNGDTTGYGFHGDFLNGWDMDVQTGAVQDCLYTDNGGVVSACSYLSPSDDINFPRDCLEQPSVFDEPVHGMLDALPGCNPITSGPDMAPQVVCPLNSHTLNAAIQTSISSATSTTATSSSDVAAITTVTDSSLSATTDVFTTSSSTPITSTSPSASSTATESSSFDPPLRPLTVTLSDELTPTTESGSSIFSAPFSPENTFVFTDSSAVVQSTFSAGFFATETDGGIFAPIATSTSDSVSMAGSDSISTGPSVTDTPLLAFLTPTVSVDAVPGSGLLTNTITGWITSILRGPNVLPASFVAIGSTPGATSAPAATASSIQTTSASSENTSSSSGTAGVAGTEPLFSPTTTFTTIATTTPTNVSGSSSIIVSSTLDPSDAFLCSLYAVFTIEGCPPPVTTSSTTISTAATPSAPVTTPFRIRGREVFLTGR